MACSRQFCDRDCNMMLPGCLKPRPGLCSPSVGILQERFLPDFLVQKATSEDLASMSTEAGSCRSQDCNASDTLSACIPEAEARDVKPRKSFRATAVRSKRIPRKRRSVASELLSQLRAQGADLIAQVKTKTPDVEKKTSDLAHASAAVGRPGHPGASCPAAEETKTAPNLVAGKAQASDVPADIACDERFEILCCEAGHRDPMKVGYFERREFRSATLDDRHVPRRAFVVGTPADAKSLPAKVTCHHVHEFRRGEYVN
eukprot:TRINITY_DN81076_c0_g1_i1.p1 TRINITY_DN81076_c0_g1~~TRINITY_DN81076_c0_g1_i1.p1  ORF type:complete len:274 (+),score=46.57 TRINITY_DN81076_c0_g1_i1:48-824(+)